MCIGAGVLMFLLLLMSGDGRASVGRSMSAMSVSSGVSGILFLVAILGMFVSIRLRWYRPLHEHAYLLTTWALASSGRFETRAQVAEFLARAEDEVRSIPGVVSVGTGSAGPLFGGDGEGHFTIDGRDNPADGSRQAALWYDVGPTYFRTLGIPVLRGRDIAPADVVGAPLVAVVNESFVQRYFSTENPIGRVVHMIEHDDDFTIVGVVRDVPAVRPDQAASPQIFWSNRQIPRPASYFIVRVGVDPVTTGRAVRERLRAYAPDMRVTAIRTMEDFLDDALVRPRFSAFLLSTFGVIALLLSAIGTYGLVAYTVTQQRKEFGVRLALGAQRRTILSGVLRRGLQLAVIAVVLGVIGAMALTRLLATQLAGVSATDPLTFLASVSLLLVAAILASIVPALRASRVDPMESLRVE
jgi:predicted permease